MGWIDRRPRGACTGRRRVGALGRYNRFSIAAATQRAAAPTAAAAAPATPPPSPTAPLTRPALPPRHRAALAASLAGLLLAGTGSAWSAEAGSPAREIEQAYRRGEVQQATERLDQALARRPDDAALRFLHGVMLGEAGRGADARQAFERMTQDFPDLPEPYNNLAVLLAAAGQLDRARGLLETALRLDPGYRTAHENLGDVFVHLAQRAYEAAAGPRSEPALQTKLRLARELAAVR